MPTQRLSMRRIRHLMALHFGAGASARAIGRELGISPSTVREYLGRISTAGISWPLAADVTGGDFCGGARRLQPDLRRGDVDPDAAGLALSRCRRQPTRSAGRR